MMTELYFMLKLSVYHSVGLQYVIFRIHTLSDCFYKSFHMIQIAFIVNEYKQAIK